MGILRAEQRRRITGEDIERANSLIREIRAGKGYIDHLLVGKNLTAEDKIQLKDAFSEVRKDADKSIELLAYDIYSADGQYVRELIQNADDCEYSVAEKEGERPTIRFHLTDDCLVVSSNEDGFNEDNVRSICKMAQSSKTPGKYTGSKGIGFKTVFAAAYKVHVRSDPYSFSFQQEQKEGKRGLSLVSPRIEPSPELNDDEGTRFTLFQRPQDHEKRMSELLKIDHSLLLFLKHIRVIEITIAAGHTKRHIVISRQDDGHFRELTTEQDELSKESRRYIIKSRQVNKLPTKTGRGQSTNSSVQLAFGIDDNGKPRVATDNMHFVYTCLPTQPYEFPFSVNSDFDVTADRGQLKESKRNEILLAEIAKAFVEQISALSKTPEMRYRWLRYYTNQTGVWNRYWYQLQKVITSELEEASIFYSSDDERRQWRACELHHLPKCYRDFHGKPLFYEYRNERYLADGYLKESLAKLKSLGVLEYTDQEFLAHMTRDLGKEYSRFKSIPSKKDVLKEEQWHEKIMKVFTGMLEHNPKKAKKLLEEVAFVPLTNGVWIPAGKGIFFDNSSKGSTVPQDVALKIVDDCALPMRIWRPVLETLGVSKLQEDDIIDEIEAIHKKQSNSGSTLDFDRICEHLKYMHLNGPRHQKLSTCFLLFNALGHRVRRGDDAERRFYFQDTVDKLACSKLLGACKDDKVHFLHSDLARLVPDSALNQHNVTWTQWLKSQAGIKSVPVLLEWSPQCQPQLTVEFQFILDNSPEKVTKLLYRNLPRYSQQFKHFSQLSDELTRDIRVPTANGLKYSIHDTYLPSTDLCQLAQDLQVRGPILLGFQDSFSPTSSSDDFKLVFINRLKVRTELDVDFCIEVLKEIKRNDDSKEQKWDHVKRVYSLLCGYVCEGLLEDLTTRERLFEEFEKYSLVLYCGQTPRDDCWLRPSECVWDSDDGYFTGLPSILSQYENQEFLFRDILNVNLPSLCMYVEFLEEMLEAGLKEKGQNIKEMILKISSALDFGNDESSCDGIEDETYITSVESDLVAIKKLKNANFRFLPVRDPDGGFHLVSCKSRFVLPDDNGLREDFAMEVPMLDLTLSEIDGCRTLFRFLDLDTKLLSRSGYYRPRIGKYDLDQDETHSFRGKASAICGCANFIVGIRDTEELNDLYERLQKVVIYTCDKLKKQFILSYRKDTFEGSLRPAFVHVEEDEGHIDIFIPKDEEEKKCSKLFRFPEAVMNILGIQDLELKQMVTGIVAASSTAELKLLMEDARISYWPTAEEALDSWDSESEEEWESGSQSESHSTASSEPLVLPLRERVTSGFAHSTLPVQRPVSRQSSKYEDIVQCVRTQARAIDFPENGAIAESKGAVDYHHDRLRYIFKKGNWAQDERHAKVGAAGEYFVLKRILPGFSLDNWTSSVRHHIPGVGQWVFGRETSDLEYKDNERVLTKLLIEKNYLESAWARQRPRYLIEIKTSSNECGDPFYVSRAQYRRMKENTISSEMGSSTIYMLCRIFQIDQCRVGLRIFVDPWSQRNETLKFESEKWIVRVTDS